MSLKEPMLSVEEKEPSFSQDLERRTGDRWRSFSRAIAKKAIIVLVFLAIWWIVTGTKLLPAFAVPSPLAVANAAKGSLHEIFSQSLVTVERVIIAVAVIWVVGALCGILIGMTPRLWPLLSLGRALYAVPIVVVYPLLGVWFGVGATSKIVFGVISGILPMSLMSAAAVRSIDDNVFLLFASLGVSRTTMFRRAVLPAALPGVISAMRLSGSLGLVSVVVGEMLLSGNGIGYWIANAGAQFEGPSLYEGIIVVLIFAVLMNSFVGFLERRIAVAYG